jgi:thymidylate synthase (FAD)
MGKFVEPKVYYLGATALDTPGLVAYLTDTDNDDFLTVLRDAKAAGLSDGECLCSFYAKLCYKSLTVGGNQNITRVRDIPDNLRGVLDQAHGSVLEHCQVNFVAHNVSRVFEVELVRHRVGSAFSIESGRYKRTAAFDMVLDPILDPVKDLVAAHHAFTEDVYRRMVERLGLDYETDRDHKKKVTSALRRILPEGKAKEIGFSLNLRSLRHVVQMRTAAGAEREIRLVFGQVYRLVKARFPCIFADAREREADGLLEVYGMRMNPYEAGT